MPSHQPNVNRRSSNNHLTQDVRLADIGGGRAPTPSDRSQMNPILPEHNSNLPPMSMRYNKEDARPSRGPGFGETVKQEHERKGSRSAAADEDYDESAADALLSIGNPQVGQKRSLVEEKEDENKKKKGNEEELKEENKLDEEEEGEIKKEKNEDPVKEEGETSTNISEEITTTAGSA